MSQAKDYSDVDRLLRRLVRRLVGLCRANDVTKQEMLDYVASVFDEDQ